MKQLFLISCCSLFLFISCQKERLPKLTEEGKNTFGCKINGKNWVPHGTGGFGGSDPTSGGFFQNTHTIFITAYNGRESIEFYLENVFNSGEYSLSGNNGGSYYIRGDNTSIPDISYITDSQHTGKVEIVNYDTTNKIVSGTFQFTAVNKEGETVRITEGRFDIKSH